MSSSVASNNRVLVSKSLLHSAPRAVVVVPESLLATTIVDAITDAGFRAELVASGTRGSARILRSDLDLAIVDLAVPDRPGLDVVRDVREAGLSVPVVAIGSDNDVGLRIAALNAGADDFVALPFALPELVARCRALVRRAQGPRWAPLSASEPIEIAGRMVSLTPRERSVLEYLQRRRGEVVSKEELSLAVWGVGLEVASHVIDVHVGHLRDKLAGLPIKIETVRGVGIRVIDE
jgi:DNA-binding response OmpR family regulator